MKSMGSMGSADLTSEEWAWLADEREEHFFRNHTPPTELLSEEEETEIAYPEDRYGIACIICGIEAHLQMVPHRGSGGLLCGWVFCCEKCRPAIIGRRMWWSGQDE